MKDYCQVTATPGAVAGAVSGSIASAHRRTRLIRVIPPKEHYRRGGYCNSCFEPVPRGYGIFRCAACDEAFHLVKTAVLPVPFQDLFPEIYMWDYDG